VDVIREFLRQLCSEDREILRLRYYVGMTLEEMALHFNAPLNTVYSRLKRAENRLVKLLKKGGKFNV
jgi:RNA polymerase sigma factor (sigma-70 family)